MRDMRAHTKAVVRGVGNSSWLPPPFMRKALWTQRLTEWKWGYTEVDSCYWVLGSAVNTIRIREVGLGFTHTCSELTNLSKEEPYYIQKYHRALNYCAKLDKGTNATTSE